jgi:hypothetical protein
MERGRYFRSQKPGFKFSHVTANAQIDVINFFLSIGRNGRKEYYCFQGYIFSLMDCRV